MALKFVEERAYVLGLRAAEVERGNRAGQGRYLKFGYENHQRLTNGNMAQTLISDESSHGLVCAIRGRLTLINSSFAMFVSI